MAANGGDWVLQQSFSGQLVTGADFNADGRTDLLINSLGFADVYLGQADGSVQLGVSIRGSARLAADLNDDGNWDVELQRDSGLSRCAMVRSKKGKLSTCSSRTTALVLISTSQGNELHIDYGPTDQVNASCLAR